jgi:hypothetical protein
MFSKLKLIKSYLKVFISQEDGLGIINCKIDVNKTQIRLASPSLTQI